MLTQLQGHEEDPKGQGGRDWEGAIWKVLENGTRQREFTATEVFAQMPPASAVEEAFE